MGQRLGRMRYALHGTEPDFQLATGAAGRLINVEAVAGFMAGLRRGAGATAACVRMRARVEGRGLLLDAKSVTQIGCNQDKAMT